MKKYLFLSIYMSFWAVGLQYLIFPEQIVISAPVIFISSCCVWLLILTSSRFLNSFALIFAHICFFVLLLYHQFFSEALSLKTIRTQYQEGWHAFIHGFDNISFSIPDVVLLLSLFFSLFLVLRGAFCPFKILIKIAIALP